MRVWCPRRIGAELVGSHAGLLPGQAAQQAHMTGLTRGGAHTPGIPVDALTQTLY